MDFMSDNLYNGRRFRVFNVLESYGKDYFGFEVDTSINGNRVCSVLEHIVWLKGMQEMITVDNGSEFIGKALDAWVHRHGVKLWCSIDQDNPLCVNINVASIEETSHGIFKSSQGRYFKESFAS